MNEYDTKLYIACETVNWEFKCPRQWQDLQASNDPSIRFCGHCEKSVHYCANVEELNTFARKGKCIAWSNVPLTLTHDLAWEAMPVIGQVTAPFEVGDGDDE